jgi:hypothetical protein
MRTTGTSKVMCLVQQLVELDLWVLRLHWFHIQLPVLVELLLVWALKH